MRFDGLLLDLFSPETYEAFSQSDQAVSGFRPRQRNVARRVQAGDKLLCYVTRLSRWVGLLEVVDGPYEDCAPIFYEESDPFTVRFHVRSAIWLPIERAIPIHETLLVGPSFVHARPESGHIKLDRQGPQQPGAIHGH